MFLSVIKFRSHGAICHNDHLAGPYRNVFSCGARVPRACSLYIRRHVCIVQGVFSAMYSTTFRPRLNQKELFVCPSQSSRTRSRSALSFVTSSVLYQSYLDHHEVNTCVRDLPSACLPKLPGHTNLARNKGCSSEAGRTNVGVSYHLITPSV